MRLLSLFVTCIILSLAAKGQDKQYLYYFDAHLNMTDSKHADFYGTGETEGDRLRLMLFGMRDKHLIMIQHFMDSSLQVSDGLFTSFFIDTKKESEGEYEKGQKNGWWEQWDTTGNIVDSSLYEDGQLTLKKSVTYFPNITQVIISDLKNHRSSYEYYDKTGHFIPADTSHKNDEDKIFIKEEIEPAFPGGSRSLKKYLVIKIKDQLDESDNNSTCVVRFVVRKSGEITDMQTVSGNSKLASIVVRAIKDGPKWIPGQQNGRSINAYKTLTVSYP